MIWLLLILNVATTLIAAKKRVLPYAILTAIFTLLVVGQAFQMQADLQDGSLLQYPYSTISEAGFHHALWYVLAVSLISFVMCLTSRGYRRSSQPSPRYEFNPAPWFYLLFTTLLVIVAIILIFGVVGLSAFLTTSRPGNIPGATLFIVLMGLGILPLLLKLMFPGQVRAYDILCFAISLLVTAGFSRLHVILYLLVLLITYFYARGWADRAISLRTILLFAGSAVLLTVFFFVSGAIRDAENYTQGSIGDLLEYSLDHPQTSLLSVQLIYRVSIEGMSGVAGAFSDAQLHPATVHRDYGVWSFMGGLTQMVPGALKQQLRDSVTFISSLYWYKKGYGNVSPGIETAFVSFGWAGVVIYPLLFWGMFWKLSVFVLEHRLSPPLRLTAFMWFGCGICFVRGSWPDWIAFSLAYFIFIYMSWPLFALCTAREPVEIPV